MLSAGEGWGGRRRGPASALTGAAARQGSFLRDIQEKVGDHERDVGGDPRTETKRSQAATVSYNEKADGEPTNAENNANAETLIRKDGSEEPAFENWEDDPEVANADDDIGSAVSANVVEHDTNTVNGDPSPNLTPNPAEVKWQYVDDQGITQGG